MFTALHGSRIIHLLSAYLALGKLVNETKYYCLPSYSSLQASPGEVNCSLASVMKVAVRIYNKEMQLCYGGTRMVKDCSPVWLIHFAI